MTRHPPAAWVHPWPDGDVLPGAPRAARWVADLATALRNAAEAGTSLDDIATSAGVSSATIQRLLNGATWPRFPVAIAVSRQLSDQGHLDG